MCVPWELNPQPFALLTQCSTTEPQEHRSLPNKAAASIPNDRLMTDWSISWPTRTGTFFHKVSLSWWECKLKKGCISHAICTKSHLYDIHIQFLVYLFIYVHSGVSIITSCMLNNYPCEREEHLNCIQCVLQIVKVFFKCTCRKYNTN